MDVQPGLPDIQKAAERLATAAVRTPLLRSPALDARTGGKVFLKLETLQRTGAFKFRGAFNRLSNLSAGERTRGVVTFSSGNHGQAVAAAAAMLGIQAAVFMPSDAPAIKKSRTRSLGAAVVEYDRLTGDREAMIKSYSAEHGSVLIHPFEDFDVIAGQGTVGLEIIEDLRRLGTKPDIIIVNTSGGGLVSGISIAVKSLCPTTKIFLAEPKGFDRFARSFKAGARVANERKSGSICDALLAVEPGLNTFRITSALCSGTVCADDEEVMEAMGFVFDECKLVVEPGGAAGLAAVLAGRVDLSDKTAVIVLSGGNVDRELFAAALSSRHFGIRRGATN